MKALLSAAVILITYAVAPIAYGQSNDDPYTIMKPEPGHRSQPRPEPWLLPPYQSPRGTKQHVETRKPPPSQAPRVPAVPPPIYVPETGRLLPNLPPLPGSGAAPNGAEDWQDRAARCARQAGVYGDAAGNRAAYINSCINNR